MVMELINSLIERYSDDEDDSLLHFSDMDEFCDFVADFNDYLDSLYIFENFGGGHMTHDRNLQNAFVVLWFYEEDASVEFTRNFEICY